MSVELPAAFLRLPSDTSALFVTELKIKNPNYVYVYCQLIISWSIYVRVSELLETLVPRIGMIVSSLMYLCANALEGSDPPPPHREATEQNIILTMGPRPTMFSESRSVNPYPANVENMVSP
jgi:hypothetical protein